MKKDKYQAQYPNISQSMKDRWANMSTDEREQLTQAMSKATKGINAKKFTLLSPTGQIIEGRNLQKFCDDNPELGLDPNSLRNTRNGKQKQHKGYRLLK